MALGSLIGGIAAGALKTGASALASRALGGGDDGSRALSRSSRGARLNAGGLTGRGGEIQSTAARRNLVDEIAGQFGEQAGVLRGLRQQFTPGRGPLTAAIDNARNRGIGNLRENLSRRRVLGSSFAQDALARAEAEFGQAESEAFLQELDVSQQLLEREFEARRAEFQTGLDDLNLQAEVGAQLASGVTAQLGANARLKAELAARNAAAGGQFFGKTFEPVADRIGTSIGNFFSGSSNAVPPGFGAFNPNTTTQGFIF